MSYQVVWRIISGYVWAKKYFSTYNIDYYTLYGLIIDDLGDAPNLSYINSF